MKKRKVIHPKNLPVQINILSVVVTFWFLWEHLIREWERTLLIVLYSVLLI